jgi:hypothetical protein
MIATDKHVDTSELYDKGKYLSLLGKLSYLAVMTRPDIAFAVNKLAQMSAAPTTYNWHCLIHVLKYVSGTRNFRLKYSNTGDVLFGYSDADFAGCPATRRSTSGYLFVLGGAAISWRSTKQPVVALSSTEAEYIAGALATQEIIYLRVLMRDFGFDITGATKLYIDNRGAIALGNNFISNKRTKHIDIKFHFLREKIHQGEVYVLPISTVEMAADCLTKPLRLQKLQRCLEIIFGKN